MKRHLITEKENYMQNQVFIYLTENYVIDKDFKNIYKICIKFYCLINHKQKRSNKCFRIFYHVKHFFFIIRIFQTKCTRQQVFFPYFSGVSLVKILTLLYKKYHKGMSANNLRLYYIARPIYVLLQFF